MRWDHLAPTAPEAVREAHRLLGIAGEALAAIVLANGDDTSNPGRLRIATNRVERARRVLETGVEQWLAGQCIHYGQHRYISTYCQHALAQEAEHGPSDDADAMHARCRLACKVCDQPCRCPAPHCPCNTARNRGSVGGATPTTATEDPMARPTRVNGNDDDRDQYPKPPPQRQGGAGKPGSEPPRNLPNDDDNGGND